MLPQVQRRWLDRARVRSAAAVPGGLPETRSYCGPQLSLTIALVLIAGALAGCRSRNALPEPGSAAYRNFLHAFYTGLAGLQVGDDARAEKELDAATKLVPGEPAAWADYGVLALRQRNYDAAAERLERSRALAPDNDHIHYLLGLLESERGNSAAAIPFLRAAVAENPRNLRALYQLASEVERQGDPASDAQFQQLMEQLLKAAPGNLAAELELSRVAAKRGDAATLRATVARIAAQSSAWPPEVKEQLTQLQTAAAGTEPRSAATRSTFLRNVLMRVPEFRNNLADLKPAPGEGAQPLVHLLRLANPPSRPDPADTGLRFQVHSPEGFAPPAGGEPWTWAGAISLGPEGAPTVAAANSTQVRLASGATLPFPGARDQGPAPEGVLGVDFNYDFKTDLVFAGGGGVRFFRQEDPAHFTDVTAATKLPQTVLQGNYSGAWAVDIEADGDLDVLLSSAGGEPLLLRNNGDGTFAVQRPFAGVVGLKQFSWVDLNGDGNPDVALLDAAGRLHVFLNRRSGSFHESVVDPALGRVRAITAADLGSEGVLTVAAVEDSGRIVRLNSTDEGAHWSAVEIAHTQVSEARLGEVRLLAADVDNNGAVDLLLVPVADPKRPASQSGVFSGAEVFLGTDAGRFLPGVTQAAELASTLATADLNGNGHLALVGVDAKGSVSLADSEGTKGYHWQTIRPRARVATGDQRVNSFGVGGEIEVRSGLLLQKQAITGPQVHFGLGSHTETEVARILWPNGSVRAEFALKSDQQVVTEQRLKGSCPFLFAWNGQRMKFVKDSVPWGSAIGLRINALGAPAIAATEEWYKIGRDELAPKDGAYDLRITGELWETYYYDALGLMTVDHPEGTEVFVDERFAVPPVKLAITAVREPQPIARAIDDHGSDVTETVRRLDGRYLDTFSRGQYQGIARDHFVEVELPSAADVTGPLWLIARGWLHPSDSSVNVALGQGSGDKPRWLSMELADGRGGWRVARPSLGFPAGRNKICLFDLAGLFRPGEPRRLRLRTNLEIYWDQIEWAQGAPQTQLRVTRLNPAAADLRFRGFSEISQADASSPEVPDYNRVAATAPIWRDLEGFYTRFGDVRELLAKTDDRSVIMNAGDELALRFAAPPPPSAGMLRDFVLTGDGWIKDGDYNSTHSETVLPYPYHARRDYNAEPGTLEQDWVYRHHTADWDTLQTRYISGAPFRDALRAGGDR